MTDSPPEILPATLGASQVAAALGYSPFATPLEVYQRLRGEAPPQPANIRMAMGLALENLVLAEAERALAAKIVNRQQRVTTAKFAYLHATIDGEISPLVGIEAKTTSNHADWGEDGTDEVPPHYRLQVQTQALLKGWVEVYIPVLFLSTAEFAIYRVPADPGMQMDIIADSEAFMARVRDGRPPDPVTRDDLARRWPRDNGATVTADSAVIEACERLRTIRAEMKPLEDEESDLKAALKMAIGEAATLADADGRVLATWRKAADGKALDAKRLQDEQPEIWRAYQAVKPGTRRMLLK